MCPSYTAVFSPIAFDGMAPSPPVALTETVVLAVVAAAAGPVRPAAPRTSAASPAAPRIHLVLLCIRHTPSQSLASNYKLGRRVSTAPLRPVSSNRVEGACQSKTPGVGTEWNLHAITPGRGGDPA
jgi:hypothetical protein